jgi:general secretion pathway protein D
VLTPHVIRDQTDLRRIFERKMQERQEFIDRYFVFADSEWQPPRDWSRTNGLVEDIRQAYAEIEEQARLEEESQPPDDTERVPSAPIELPSAVREGSGAQLAPKAAPAAPAAAPAPAPAKAPARPTRPRRSRGGRSEAEPPIIINPIARSVNAEVEQVE